MTPSAGQKAYTIVQVVAPARLEMPTVRASQRSTLERHDMEFFVPLRTATARLFECVGAL